MGTNYKILGQVQGTNASALQQLSMFPDPNLEYYTTETSHSHSDAGPMFYVDNRYGNGGTTSHTQTHYHTNQYAPNSANSSGRTNAISFFNHNDNSHPVWSLKTSIDRPYLKSGQTYTLSMWVHCTGDGHWQNHGHGGMHFSNGASNYDILPYAHYGWQNNMTYPVTSGDTQNGWRQHYRTFQGGGGYFDLFVRMWNHSGNYWQRLYLDNVMLLEGAVPVSLLPTRPLDGSVGNPNALYSAPFTTRSEGWQGTSYLSPTVRKLTGSWQNLYVVPDNDQAVVSTLSISNIGTSSTTYRVAVVKYGETLSAKHLIAFDHPLPGNSNESLTIGMALSAGDKVIVQSDSDKVTFSLFGSEMTP